MRKYVALVLVLAVVELWLLVQIGGAIGFFSTTGIALASAVIGAFLAKSEGLRVLRGMREAMQERRAPTEGMLGGVLVLVGGMLLIAPGVLSDVAGVALLFPPTRRLVGRALQRRFERHVASAQAGGVQGVSAVAQPFTGAFGGSGFQVRVIDLAAMAAVHRSRDASIEVIDTEGEVIDEAPPKLLLPP